MSVWWWLIYAPLIFGMSCVILASLYTIVALLVLSVYDTVKGWLKR